MSGPTHEHDDLTNTLHRKADDFVRLGGHDLDLAQVVSRAGEIRRARRMRANIVMAAVALAVALPVGIAALGVGPAGNKPSTLGSPSGSPTLTDTSAIGLGDLPIGGTTSVGLADSSRSKIYLPHQSIPLTGGGEVRALAWVGSGFLIARDDGSGNQRVSYVGIGDAGTDVTWPYAGSGIAVSPARDIGAFVEPDGTVLAVQDSASRYFPVGTTKLPAGDSYVVEAVIGENCSGRSDLDAGCTIYVRSTGAHPAIWVASPHAPVAKVTDVSFEGLTRLTGISARGSVAGMTSATDTGSCWTVRASDSTSWSTCRYSLISFSGDGNYLVAGDAYQDGLGDHTFAVLDARTGEVVLDLKTAQNAFIGQRAWEDLTHVVVTVYDQGVWGVERINVVTGQREYAGPVDSSGELTVSDADASVPAYQLSASR